MSDVGPTDGVTTLPDDPDHAPSGEGGHRTPVALPVASLDDPHMQPAARHPKRTENIIIAITFVGVLGVAAFGAVYVDALPDWTLGVTMGVGLFALGFGMTAWGKYLMPRGPFVEERHTLASSERERTAMTAALVERSGAVVRRRKLLLGMLGSGLGIFGVVAIFPLLRSLGPLPGTTLDKTNWKRGSLLVDSTGRPIHRDTLQPGGIVTVFPQGYEDNIQAQEMDQTVLIRAQTGNLVTEPGRASWAPEGYVAYSKLCTHLGCPVGLYEQELKLLVCPCHQSMFNITDGAVPQFGPAPRPLPQLPLYIDDDGYLRAQAGYDQPVGPGFWERS